MYINKLSVTRIEDAERVNLLHSSSCSFEQYKSSKLVKYLYLCLDLRHFMMVTKTTLAFRHKNQTLDNFIKPRSISKQLCIWLAEVVTANKLLFVKKNLF